MQVGSHLHTGHGGRAVGQSDGQLASQPSPQWAAAYAVQDVWVRDGPIMLPNAYETTVVWRATAVVGLVGGGVGRLSGAALEVVRGHEAAWREGHWLPAGPALPVDARAEEQPALRGLGRASGAGLG